MYDRSSYGSVPARILDILDAYAEEGRQTGDFVGAVLENNLFEAVGHADCESMAALKMIVTYVHCQMPQGCWGSPEKVKTWREKKRAERDTNND
jgi:hypothetical protein